MDERFLHCYNKELQFIREKAGEFAQEFPKIAGRLGLDGFECADPYVERLLEGFAFLTARVQLKLEDQFPQFTQHLLEMIYPHYLCPLPSMTIAQFKPDLSEGSLAEGFVIERGTHLRSRMGPGDKTYCQYVTAHELTLWPIQLTQANYLPSRSAVLERGVQLDKRYNAAIQLRLQTTAGFNWSDLTLDQLPLFLRGSGKLPHRIYEQIFAQGVALVVKGVNDDYHDTLLPLPMSQVTQQGFDKEQALLPYDNRSFDGFRLLQEYFAFPERFLFFQLEQLQRVCQRFACDEIDIFILLGQSDHYLYDNLSKDNFVLFCSPAINLFEKRADRIYLTQRQHEYSVVVDNTRPLDYEVHSVTDVLGYGVNSDDIQPFKPFYALNHKGKGRHDFCFYTLNRIPRLLSHRRQVQGARSSYSGHDVYISLVDGTQAPLRPDLKQLAVTVRCTNRDLPLMMPVGQGNTDFTLDQGAPVTSIRCVAGPSKPKSSLAKGENAWRLINHLSMNYLSMLDDEHYSAHEILKEMLSLYSDQSNLSVRKQVDAILNVTATPVIKRLPLAGPVSYGRGVALELTFDEVEAEGYGPFLLGAVLERFLAKYVNMNSFTQTSIRTVERGVLVQWPIRLGNSKIL